MEPASCAGALPAISRILPRRLNTATSAARPVGLPATQYRYERPGVPLAQLELDMGQRPRPRGAVPGSVQNGLQAAPVGLAQIRPQDRLPDDDELAGRSIGELSRQPLWCGRAGHRNGELSRHLERGVESG
jgi:hypothetical protein